MKFDIQTWCEDNITDARLNAANQIVGVCPWCSKSNHFYVDAEKGHYICFACDEKGRHMIGLIAHVEGISKGEARRYLMRNQIEFRRKETTQTLLQKISAMRGESMDEDEPVGFELPKEFIPVYSKGQWKYPLYLKERGIKRATAREWGLGWCRSGRYASRVIIPVECPNGKSFTARDVTGEQEPKYLNPLGADHARLLLGWKHHPVNGDVTLVEGPLDAIRLWQHGFPALALMGKVLHSEQLSMLTQKPKDAAITVMLDPEEVEAPYKVAAQLTFRFDDVSIATLPNGIDPGSSTRKQAWQAYDNSVPYTGERKAILGKIIKSSKEKLEKFYQ